jgi:hypothetical protein
VVVVVVMVIAHSNLRPTLVTGGPLPAPPIRYAGEGVGAII